MPVLNTKSSHGNTVWGKSSSLEAPPSNTIHQILCPQCQLRNLIFSPAICVSCAAAPSSIPVFISRTVVSSLSLASAIHHTGAQQAGKDVWPYARDILGNSHEILFVDFFYFSRNEKVWLESAEPLDESTACGDISAVSELLNRIVAPAHQK